MIQIFPANETIKKILGSQRYSRDDNYRLSFSCIQSPVNNGSLIYNCITKEFLFVTQPVKEDERKELVEKWFFVPDGFRENTLCKELESILSLVSEKETAGTITILPTTTCNANCFYCFEKGIQRTTMLPETALQVCRFIKKVSTPNKQLSLHWFGGEPLLASDIIDLICSNLISDGQYTIVSSLVTNGYLLNADLLNRAITNWGLQMIQITLDGTKEIYTRAKAFSKPIEDAYSVVLNNIKNISKTDIALVIRLNIDDYNVSDMFSLIDELSVLIENKSLITIKVSPLFENAGAFPINRSESDRISLYDSAKQLLEYVISKGFNLSSHVSRAYKRFCCTADNASSVIILPTGDLVRCENIVNLPSVGNIYDPDSSTASGKWREYLPEMPLCEKCPLFFSCRRPVGCQELSECNPQKRDWQIEQIRQCMKMDYSRFLSTPTPN
ncbi:MAG: 4Fe-4S cluster-binding domain-containing protein [Lachnospiraceae bacterium]|nr:4Fe-4S cluster-binding domain-containing protein [Lachnospiraceae bacterium]